MGDNLLRDAMIEEAKKWLKEKDRAMFEAGIWEAPRDDYRPDMLADFVMYMTGADAPTLRYVEDCDDEG